MPLDLEALRAHIRAAGYPRGTPDEVVRWRDDLAESRANLAIEGMALDAEDTALFDMMLDEALSPSAMLAVLHRLYRDARNNAGRSSSAS